MSAKLGKKSERSYIEFRQPDKNGQEDSVGQPGGDLNAARFVEIVAAMILVAQIRSCVELIHSLLLPDHFSHINRDGRCGPSTMISG